MQIKHSYDRMPETETLEYYAAVFMIHRAFVRDGTRGAVRPETDRELWIRLVDFLDAAEATRHLWMPELRARFRARFNGDPKPKSPKPKLRVIQGGK